MSTKKSLLLLGVMSLLLAACGSDDPEKEKQIAEEKAEKAAKAKIVKVDPICPQVAIVRDLETFRDYAGEKPDPALLVAAAKLTSIDGSCEYQDKGIDVSFHANIVAKHGPKLGGHHISLPMFVAVVDPADKVLNKNLMTVNVSFASDESTANTAEALHVFIPLEKEKHISGPHYRVLAGFQLTKEQLDQVKALNK